MSKAFTKEDDDAGFVSPPSSTLAIASGPFRITKAGARMAAEHPDPRVREALAAHAEVLPPVIDPKHAALGVSVRIRTDEDEERTYRLVSAEEHALLGKPLALLAKGAAPTPTAIIASVDGPIGRALLGASVGDVREVALPKRTEELEVIALAGDDESGP